MIDILLSAYNGQKFIKEQIDSIIGQTIGDWRLLISDDCSTDGTLDVLATFKEDSRIELVSQNVKYGSARDNFLNLLNYASGDYVMFCDQDDVWLPDKIGVTLRLMEELERANGSDIPLLVFTDLRVVDEDLKTINLSFTRESNIDPSRCGFKQVIAQSLGTGCTMMMNHTLLDLARLPMARDKVIMHDWWVTLIASAFGKIAYLDRPTSLYRQHASNSVGAIEYHPVKRVAAFESMVSSVEKTIVQAEEFQTVFGGRLSEKQRANLANFIKQRDGNVLSREAHLIASGCWKKGLRKVGQLIVAAVL